MHERVCSHRWFNKFNREEEKLTKGTTLERLRVECMKCNCAEYKVLIANVGKFLPSQLTGGSTGCFESLLGLSRVRDMRCTAPRPLGTETLKQD